MNNQHTPGPWAVLPGIHNNDELYVGNDGEGGPVICAVWPMGDDFDGEGTTRAANARLIAAAPELLATLKWLLTHDELNDVDMPSDLRADVEACRAVVSRVEAATANA